MKVSGTLDDLHLRARQNKWLWYFSIFCRIALAAGFLPSGFVKVNGERFTALATNHPMGSYLEALFHTGFYYPFIGVMQMTAAILLLIPRTATIGALIYFPIILNICLLSIAVRFEGSLLSSPLMVLACLYLLCWDWHKLKFIFFPQASKTILPIKKELSNNFPIKFFAGSATTVLGIIAVLIYLNFFGFIPRNTVSHCREQCEDQNDPEACYSLCNCLHTSRTFNHCMETYHNSSNLKPLNLTIKTNNNLKQSNHDTD